MRNLPIILTLLSLLLPLIPFSTGSDTLNSSHHLADGETLISTGGSFALGFFTPANSNNRHVGIWYNKVSVQTIVWVANRRNPIPNRTGTLSLSNDGRLVISDPNTTSIWSTPSPEASDPIAQLLDSGNLVVKERGGGIVIWQSFDYPTDTLLPGMKLGWNLTSGLNRNLTPWSSESDPSPGPYTVGMDTSGDPQVFLWSGRSIFWRSGPWDGLRFSGIPDMKTYSMFTFDFVDNDTEVYYSFHIHDPTVISRLIVNQSGQVQRLVWLETNKIWNLFWFAPKDQCDSVNQCGPYGLCNPNDSPSCDCLQGFDPKNPTNWALRDGKDGCVRRTPLDCRNGTDEFATVAGAKLPDTSRATVDRSMMSLDDCKAECLGNCSCKAYASANISGSGSGCVIWTAEITDLRVYTYGGQDLYVRLAAVDLGSTSNESNDNNGAEATEIVLPIVAGVLILGGIGYYMWTRKKKRRVVIGTISFSNQRNEESTGGEDLELPLYNFDTIASATDNFSIQNKLGEGGFGPVFKGMLGEEQQDIAVKRLAKTSVQGLDEFKNEVILIAKLQHRNLVRLLGCCVEGEERMLIYEYMHNKSLDLILFVSNVVGRNWRR